MNACFLWDFIWQDSDPGSRRLVADSLWTAGVGLPVKMLQTSNNDNTEDKRETPLCQKFAVVIPIVLRLQENDIVIGVLIKYDGSSYSVLQHERFLNWFGSTQGFWDNPDNRGRFIKSTMVYYPVLFAWDDSLPIRLCGNYGGGGHRLQQILPPL